MGQIRFHQDESVNGCIQLLKPELKEFELIEERERVEHNFHGMGPTAAFWQYGLSAELGLSYQDTAFKHPRSKPRLL